MTRFVLFLCIVCALAVPASAQVNVVNGTLFTLTDTSTSPDGAWSWYMDERAIIDDTDPGNTLLLVSSVSDGSGSEAGDIDLLWRNLDTAVQGRFELHDQYQDDDHDAAALYMRPDGRYVAMYAGHISDNFTRWRVSTNPHDPTSWGAEQTLNVGVGTTYNNTYYLPDDNGGAGRTYNFTRAVNFDPTVQVSNDDGSTWSTVGKLLTEGGGGDRPYLRYASDGDKIHFITTERHPRDFANSIYHGYIQDGVLYNSDGTVIDNDLFDFSGVAPSNLTPVFKNGTAFGGTTMNRAWTINIEIDNTGNPVGIFTARANDSNQDHRFFYARYDGVEWQVHEMAKAGAYLYSAEDDYTGLASIDPSNPNVVYMSSDIDPRDDSSTSRYELYKGVTSDFGETWTWEAITEDSTIDNIRPVVPNWDGQNTAVTWMRGTYSSYTNWNTELVGLSFAATDPKSLLWRGDAGSPDAWDIDNTANWDSGGGVTDVYNDGDEVAFDDTAASFNVELQSAVTPIGVAFNNSANAYTVTGAGMGGNGDLRVIGGGTVTLANGANTYTGDTMIARGTLALSGAATLDNTPHINVMDNGTFDVSATTAGSYALDNQTLTIDGDVVGDIVATNGSTVEVNSDNSMDGNVTVQSGSLVTGAGRIMGNLNAQSGSTVRVGGIGLPTNNELDDNTYVDATEGVGGNTALAAGGTFDPVQPGAAAPDVWVVRGLDGGQGALGNGGSLFQAGPDAVDNAPVLQTTISGLTPGETYTVFVNYWTATGSNWRVQAGSSQGSLTLFDANYTAVAGATDGTDLNTLNYDVTPLITEGNRTMWGAPVGDLVANGSGEIEVFIDDFFSGENDPRTWYDGVTYSTNQQATLSETMTITGDLTMNAGAILALDIFDPDTLDLLSVGGLFTAAGGTLDVTLQDGAPAPQLGDTFDIFDFGSASGAFDALNLPSLDPGLFWKTSNLLTTGVLEVVDTMAAVPGDADGDGDVDLDDYNIMSGNMYTNVAGGASDGDFDNDGDVDFEDFVVQALNFGDWPDAEETIGDLVPEPASASLLALMLVAFMSRAGRTVRVSGRDHTEK